MCKAHLICCIFAGMFAAFCVTQVHAEDNPALSASQRAVLHARIGADQAASRKRDPNLAVLEQLLAQPDNSIDLAKAEVTIEGMVDPQVNKTAILKELHDLAQAIRARFPQRDPTDREVRISRKTLRNV